MKLEDFWDNVKVGAPDECWDWLRGTMTNGYGAFHEEKTNAIRYAHRTALELTDENAAPELFVLHRCDRPICCNPKHLWWGTQKENMHDMIAKGRQRKPTPKPKQPRMPKPRNYKISGEDVEVIRLARSNGATLLSIARRFGVSEGYICRILNGKARQNATNESET